MPDDAFRKDDATSIHSATAEDFTDAVPRGNIFRATEPVVAPVTPPPTEVPRDETREPGRARTSENEAAMDAEEETARADVSTTADARTTETAGAGNRIEDRARAERAYERPMAERAEDRPAAVAVGSPPYRREERRFAPMPERRFSLGATFLGWGVASFFTLVFAAIVAAIVGGTALTTGADAVADAPELTAGAFVGLLIAVFLAYLIGGYAAGRIARWNGGSHGAAIVLWTVLFTILALIGGAALADSFDLGAFAFPLALDVGDVTTVGILAALGLLAAALLGGWLGGRLGTRAEDEERAGSFTRRGTLRGRPL